MSACAKTQDVAEWVGFWLRVDTTDATVAPASFNLSRR
jgi:hypothetical protein